MATKKPSKTDPVAKRDKRTTIRVPEAAAARIRDIAWVEQVSAADLYGVALDAWADGYEAAIGKRVSDLRPGVIDPNLPQGQQLARYRAPKAKR